LERPADQQRTTERLESTIDKQDLSIMIALTGILITVILGTAALVAAVLAVIH
jgi:hypothetical protein